MNLRSAATRPTLAARQQGKRPPLALRLVTFGRGKKRVALFNVHDETQQYVRDQGVVSTTLVD